MAWEATRCLEYHRRGHGARLAYRSRLSGTPDPAAARHLSGIAGEDPSSQLGPGSGDGGSGQGTAIQAPIHTSCCIEQYALPTRIARHNRVERERRRVPARWRPSSVSCRAVATRQRHLQLHVVAAVVIDLMYVWFGTMYLEKRTLYACPK